MKVFDQLKEVLAYVVVAIVLYSVPVTLGYTLFYYIVDYVRPEWLTMRKSLVTIASLGLFAAGVFAVAESVSLVLCDIRVGEGILGGLVRKIKETTQDE